MDTSIGLILHITENARESGLVTSLALASTTSNPPSGPCQPRSSQTLRRRLSLAYRITPLAAAQPYAEFASYRPSRVYSLDHGFAALRCGWFRLHYRRPGTRLFARGPGEAGTASWRTM